MLSCLVTVECKYLVMFKYILDRYCIACELTSDERQMIEQNTFTLKLTVPANKTLQWLQERMPHYVTVQTCIE